ncbi:MAG: alanine racemase, partial [Fulvivirga sp.]|uniref:alanine racemase n=1 Tax=Fulvivirga sp. TaxID=1931237 RepID=UPI0032EDFE76
MKITKPTLILNEGVCKANIARMVNKAQSHGLELQPHFKTHQSKAIGEWFRASGVSKITVSSVGMAMYFAENGWQDITIAFPCNILEIEAINDLAQKIELTLLVDNQAIVERLDQELHHSVSIYIEINSGGNRSGVPVNDQELIKQLAELITSTTKLNLKGLYSHAGHTYSANGEEEIVKIGSSSLNQLIELKNELMKYYPQIITCFGDTPSCSVLDDFKGINRISPGNFVFYDVMQT